MLEITELSQRPDLLQGAVEVFWKVFGNDGNYNCYYDCMLHSCNRDDDLPKFYIALHQNSIKGTYALLRNDFISRQDIFPWLACLYISPELRGNKFGSFLLRHALREASKKGFKSLYLYTDLVGYYEKYGWNFLATGYLLNSDAKKIYMKST